MLLFILNLGKQLANIYICDDYIYIIITFLGVFISIFYFPVILSDFQRGQPLFLFISSYSGDTIHNDYDYILILC